VIQEHKAEIDRKKKTAIRGKIIEDKNRKKRRWFIPVGLGSRWIWGLKEVLTYLVKFEKIRILHARKVR
jgi:hypothetical protein